MKRNCELRHRMMQKLYKLEFSFQDQKIPSAERTLTIRLPFPDAFALSAVIGQSFALLHAHMLWPIATGTPTQPSKAIPLPIAIRKKKPKIKNGDTKIPELVLAITCDKRPQKLQVAGCSRLDQRTAKELTPCLRQWGHGVI